MAHKMYPEADAGWSFSAGLHSNWMGIGRILEHGEIAHFCASRSTHENAVVVLHWDEFMKRWTACPDSTHKTMNQQKNAKQDALLWQV